MMNVFGIMLIATGIAFCCSLISCVAAGIVGAEKALDVSAHWVVYTILLAGIEAAAFYAAAWAEYVHLMY